MNADRVIFSVHKELTVNVHSLKLILEFLQNV